MDENVFQKEKEASEVLHSLLSAPRVLNKDKKRHEDDDHDYVAKPELGIVEEQVIDHQVFSTDIKAKLDETPKKKLGKSKSLRKDCLEDDVQEVLKRFQLGCDCIDNSCFQGLNPEAVYKHRLNIAELTKEEHDMYLMGVTMACLADPTTTTKQKTRQRLRSSYVYRGRKVCQSAFIYLENCSLYQLKRIRKHVIDHGVAPRVHGNHGKKPHNVFSLDIYRRATDFLKSFINEYTNPNSVKTFTLPYEVTRKTVHKKYENYVRDMAPTQEKLMGYSTFRHFMKEQFPQIKFCKTDSGQSNSFQACKPSSSRSHKTDMSEESDVVVIPGWNTSDLNLIVPIQEIDGQQYVDLGEGNIAVVTN